MKRMLLIAGFIFAAALTRFLPHPPNVTPLMAMGLFGGTYFTDKRIAILIPVLAMFCADLFLGIHATMLWVYSSVIIMVGLGILLEKHKNAATIGGASILGSLLFYLITNFGVWATGGGFAHPITIYGLTATYIDGLPFLRNALAGDLVFTAILFGSYELLIRKLPELQPRTIDS